MAEALIRLVEVGPRDGLQNEPRPVPLAAKVAFIDALSEAGAGEIEAGAFVSPKAVPQMADSSEVFKAIKRKPGVVYSALVPNEKGLEAAVEAKVDKIAVFTAASETFNQKNINASIAESISRFEPVLKKKGKLRTRAYISTAFYCPYEGKVEPDKVLTVVKTLEQMGIEEYSIGDTIGRAAPPDVARLLEPLLKRVAADRVFMHFHDTYGMAIANAIAAWKDFGITGFDASAGGLGGCPYAPGAGGNAAMEDLAFALRSSGAPVKLDLARVRAAALALEGALGHPPASRLSRVSPEKL